MSIEPGTYELGPENATLSVRTSRRGAIAKVGHDLLIEVGAWGATVQIGADLKESLLELTADSRSLRVLEGTGGIQPLGKEEKSSIDQTIDEEVLKGTTIAFRSRSVSTARNGQLHVAGELELGEVSNPIEFDLNLGGDGHVAGSAAFPQSVWGIKPYTALFGTLKVADEVQVLVDGRLSSV